MYGKTRAGAALVQGLLCCLVSCAAFGQPAGLRSVDSFASITDADARARALFIEAGKVIMSPRCQNCHPKDDRPTQGEDMHPHLPWVVRGADDKGAVGLRCSTCHQGANFEPAGVPGHPLWHAAPLVM